MSITKTRTTNKFGCKNARSRQTIQNGINILQTALDKGITVTASMKKFKFASNYICNLRDRVDANVEAGNITKGEYNKFLSLLKKYEKSKA